MWALALLVNRQKVSSKGLADATGLQGQTVAGTAAALAADLQAGRIDAHWQGSALPIPATKQVADAVDRPNPHDHRPQGIVQKVPRRLLIALCGPMAIRTA